ncbi:hypothetical protein [Virgibacillus halodenitrificans]|uniref:hypothetical protein n=1 Tax=Virgibacillus halodenitrificans TaxID=1482 RepID=UPI000EF537C8|nr:hypothetical protein [Virgibacillus halodenitrificans]
MDAIYQEISPILNQKTFDKFKDFFIEIGEEEISKDNSTHKRVHLMLNREHAVQVELSVGKITKNEDEIFLSVQIVENAITSNILDNALLVEYIDGMLKIKNIMEAIVEEISSKLNQIQTDAVLKSHFGEKIERIQKMSEEEKEAVLNKYQAIF